MNIRAFLEHRISAALHAAGAPMHTPALVQPSARLEFGDFQANGVMGAAKALKTNPRQLAEQVIAQLDLEGVAHKVEIAGPGFINISLDNDWLARALESASANHALNRRRPAGQPDTVVVDYSSPNLAKEMHVGHLRSTIIGDAVVRVLEYLGHYVIRQNHVGDWGTQFGMLLAHMKLDGATDQAHLHTRLADLEQFYREAKQRYDSDPAFAATAREYVVKLQGGDAECRRLWQAFINESLAHCEEVYSRLGVTLTHAHIKPESAYNDDLPQLVDELQSRGLAQESDGALCVFLPEFKGKDGAVIPVIVRKSDGGFLYATSDLAAIRYRVRELQATRVLYFVDARQHLHLTQVFAAARHAGWVEPETSLEHLPFGTMMGEDGKPFKTRSGGTVKLIELLDEAEQRAYKLVSERNTEFSEEQRRTIARAVGIGAVKYADLAKNRTSDYIFNWDTMLAMEGNTAPYLQYAYVRIRSLFRRAELPDAAGAALQLSEPAERRLALKLNEFDDVLAVVANDCTPNLLCNHLFELAGLFMTFYEACPVLKAEDAVKASRLRLCQITADTIKLGLNLLGIEVLEQM
ncbi:MAG: arginine--tRNA ligase [Gammaproteobacteria bacterium]|nr:arginine--tRNA ligase [Gammaproteobacteria bacterium]